MVLGTFISAPLMYATARVTLIEAVNETQYHEVVYFTEVDVSAISLVGAVSYVMTACNLSVSAIIEIP